MRLQALAEYSGTTSGIMGTLNRASAAALARGAAVLDYLGEHIFVTVTVLVIILWLWHMLTRVKTR